MHAARKTALAFSILTSLTLAGPAARAQAVLGGHYDKNPTPPGDENGYRTTGGQSYTVTSAATFRDNRTRGLFADGASTVTVTGGAFTGNAAGLLFLDGSRATVTGGAFTGNTQFGLSAINSSVTVGGGVFTGNGSGGLSAVSSGVIVTGGAFGKNGKGDLFADSGSVITVFGAGLRFVGAPVGTAALSTGAGLITGVLQNNAAPSRLRFKITHGSRIRLVNAPRR